MNGLSSRSDTAEVVFNRYNKEEVLNQIHIDVYPVPGNLFMSGTRESFRVTYDFICNFFKLGNSNFTSIFIRASFAGSIKRNCYK